MTRRSSLVLQEVRRLNARMMAAATGSPDERYERIFDLVPREAFLGPGPWHIAVHPWKKSYRHRYIETPSDDPVHVNQNVLVALDRTKGINNGEPLLHAGWLGSVNPQRGEVVTHIGAGTGYYTAMLSMLTLPYGSVHAFEIDDNLAERARENLVPFEGVSVTHGDATVLTLPSSDVIYVNAGVVAPPAHWLESLRPGGRMIFPWRPNEDVAVTMLITRGQSEFSAQPLMPAWFIPCIGASDPRQSLRVPDRTGARTIRSAWLTRDRKPDESAVAIFRDVWFSNNSAAPTTVAA
ncbi:SAM-dependent methyltransferase [Rhizobium bangladeshense]|uniref:protein-L-isoaspartate O-methyltransferase family protein n=2 Tax=Rhizobium/Agrobacterium group TaxID=227290 RepID=UPI001B338390|nr:MULTISPECIES: SAM-dependent methyltransferase [unclassified Rhizobium]MBX4909628.1 SAM-dependent methyltransferase [Rhizobium bangladeshense]MBX5234878.1 SAM-dependent methyltransferase [Rhizobium sp. NLR4a]MBX5252364.1 SAM-dependent methyltransferase [Rhizobium sp. NLR4b]MBX5258759.1 SAM-dependent methyltransferase [Rhizobium sp. NLR16b]MBX5270916.1 SAM-dependent methyltransferase [Rhizobium sp. NLR17b]MBX5283918.1 SAM-dependent methyltransferase [Rhizobium sp. NLR10a]MBX5301788.1 SAM-de